MDWETRLSPEQLKRLKKVRFWSRLLDESFRIPGINYRIGIDALVGLIPVVGDVATTAISVYIIREAARLGVPKEKLFRMAFNTGVDFALGAVPVAGDVVDMVWKANKRNTAMIEEHLRQPQRLDREPYLDI